MKKEDLAKLLEDQIDLTKSELYAVLAGLLLSVGAVIKESKTKGDRFLVWLIAIIVFLQCILIAVALIWLR